MPDNDDTVTINGRTYPSKYPPGMNWALDEAWGILDAIKDGEISHTTRSFLAGMITGVLMKKEADWKAKYEALEAKYQDGN